MTGLEGRDLSVWTTKGGSAAITTNFARTGDASQRYAGSAYYAKKALSSAHAELFIRFGFRWNYTAALGRHYILLTNDSANANQINIGMNTGGHLKAYRSFTLLGTGDIALNEDTWYCIEVRILVDNSNGIVQIKVNGVMDLDLSGIDTRATGISDIGYIMWGSSTASHYVAVCWFDDIVVNNTLGGVNDSWPGQGGIYGLFPSGAGNSTDLTPDAGDNYARVNETPPDDDTSYVEGSTPTDHDSYAMDDLTPTAGTISAVCWHGRAKLTEAGAGDIGRHVRVGGTDYQGAGQALDVSYVQYEEILEEDPDTSAAWIIAGVNAMEAGVVIV